MKKNLKLILIFSFIFIFVLIGLNKYSHEKKQDFMNVKVIEVNENNIKVKKIIGNKKFIIKSENIKPKTLEVKLNDEIRIVYNKESINKETEEIEIIARVYLINENGQIISN